MENRNFNAKELIQEVQEKVKEVVVKHAKSDKECLAVASALLGFVVPLYKEALGNEQAAMMMYNIADELAIEAPLKVNVKKIFIDDENDIARNVKKHKIKKIKITIEKPRKFRKKK